jgi:hypothetical protein
MKKTNQGTEVYVTQYDKIAALAQLKEILGLVIQHNTTDDEIEHQAQKIKMAADKLFGSVPIAVGDE